MKIQSFTVGAFQENTYLLVDEGASRCVLIDPGEEGPALVRAVRESGAELESIWLTHGHVDHVGAVAAIKRVWDVPVYLHPADRPLYDRASAQAAFYGLRLDPPPPPERELADGDRLRVGTLEFAVMHTPGHAPGLVVVHGHGIALVGDLVFAGSIGRTDLPLSSPADMVTSLDRLLTLDDRTVLYPGHGPPTTIGRERTGNPFLNGMARVVGG